jgi:hypothetical protein
MRHTTYAVDIRYSRRTFYAGAAGIFAMSSMVPLWRCATAVLLARQEVSIEELLDIEVGSKLTHSLWSEQSRRPGHYKLLRKRRNLTLDSGNLAPRRDGQK